MTALEVQIRRAPAADRGRALARVPSNLMAQLSIVPGDAVALRAKSETYCRAVRANGPDQYVEIDETIAERIGVKDGGTATLARKDLSALTSAIVTVDIRAGQVRPGDLTEGLFDLPLSQGDSLDVPLPMGGTAWVTVTDTDPAPAGFFTPDTILSVVGQPSVQREFGEIGGLEEEISRVQEMVATPLRRPELFERLGIQPPRGLLFVGPPGSGKTLLARAVAARTSAAFFQIDGPEIVSKHYGDSEAALRKVFDAAARQSPAIIFIDEIDAVAPRRDTLSAEKQVERRVVAQLLTLLDGLSDRGRIVVMAATNLPDSIDPALRRPGRLEREIVFKPPRREQRRDILGIHLGDAPLASDVDLDAIAEASHGYVGADLAALARETALAALARSVAAAGGEDQVDAAQLCIIASDLKAGLDVTQPALLRDAVVESPSIGWDDIGGLDDIKAALTEAVIWPLRYPESFRSLRVTPVRGLLLSGPPGSGKTLLARGLAGESGLNFIGVRPTRVLSQFLGEAERAIADLFTKARQAAPAILFFDEFDALARRRSGQDAALDRVVAQLLVEMDGLDPNANVTVLAATNRPSAIDPALLRPGRIDRILSVPLPGDGTRAAILEVHLKRRPLAKDISIPALVEVTKGFSGADLAALVQSGARRALRRVVQDPEAGAPPPQIVMDDLLRAANDLSIHHAEQALNHLEAKDGRVT